MTPNFYSQHGEDIICWQIFKQDLSAPGFFVDVGALDGVRFSNSYMLEQMGWKGICIEPHPDYTEVLKQNRPKSMNIWAAVGREDKESVPFYGNARGALSSLDPKFEREFSARASFTGFKVHNVPLVTLNAVLARPDVLQYNNGISPKIDILSIDVEGTELDVMAGLDWVKHHPRIVIAEYNHNNSAIDSQMASYGYSLGRSTGTNGVFCCNPEDARIAEKCSVNYKLIHVKHILDK